MADSDNSQQRLADLRARWEADRTSRLFLQLAEEYRRQGMPEDAIPILEEGLRAHPASGAAYVALGRCRLEAGQVEEAIEVLERVVRRDPTQMVAYRALVDCYLQSGDVEHARDRLGLYTQLNPQDPDIDKLAEQIESLESVGASAPTPPPGETSEDTAASSDAPSESATPPVPPPPAQETQSLFYGEEGNQGALQPEPDVPTPPPLPDDSLVGAATVAIPRASEVDQEAPQPSPSEPEVQQPAEVPTGEPPAPPIADELSFSDVDLRPSDLDLRPSAGDLRPSAGQEYPPVQPPESATDATVSDPEGPADAEPESGAWFALSESQALGDEEPSDQDFARESATDELAPEAAWESQDGDDDVVGPQADTERAPRSPIGFETGPLDSGYSTQDLDESPTLEVPATPAEPPEPESPSGAFRIGDLELDESVADVAPPQDLPPVDEAPDAPAGGGEGSPWEAAEVAETAANSSSEAVMETEAPLPGSTSSSEAPSELTTNVAETRQQPPPVSASQDAVSLGSLRLVPLDLPAVPAFATLVPRQLSRGEGIGEGVTEGNGRSGPSTAESQVASPAAERAGGARTATLGSLYLDQGHAEDARQIFEHVLEREPGNRVAREGLTAVEEDRPLLARDLLEGLEPAQTGVSEKKLRVLRQYLARVSEASEESSSDDLS